MRSTSETDETVCAVLRAGVVLIDRWCETQERSVLAVRRPTVPLAGVSRAARWKRITDLRVPGPKLPSVDVRMPTSRASAGGCERRRRSRRRAALVCAGNSSGINDGAAAIIVMSASKANELGLRTFGTVESYASVGVEPKIMGVGPVPAVRKALARARLQLVDIDLFELNEAFAAQSLAVLRELDIEPERINPHGGANALGHPIGASGGRILVTLLHEMRRRNSGRGVAALCVGGGQGQAAIIRNGAKP